MVCKSSLGIWFVGAEIVNMGLLVVAMRGEHIDVDLMVFLDGSTKH